MTKLCAYVIEGESITDISVYGYHDLNGNEEFLISDTVPEGYTDISSIVNWSKYSKLVKKDYKTIRKEIYISMLTAGGWANLSTEEKEICSKYFIVDASLRTEVHTVDEQIINGLTHHNESIKARNCRYTSAILEVYNRLTKIESDEILTSIRAHALDTEYITYGREGTLEGDPEGILDFIESRIGTSYENTGMSSMEYIPAGMTMQELVDRCKVIIVDGDYDYMSNEKVCL